MKSQTFFCEHYDIRTEHSVLSRSVRGKLVISKNICAESRSIVHTVLVVSRLLSSAWDRSDSKIVQEKSS